MGCLWRVEVPHNAEGCSKIVDFFLVQALDNLLQFGCHTFEISSVVRKDLFWATTSIDESFGGTDQCVGFSTLDHFKVDAPHSQTREQYAPSFQFLPSLFDCYGSEEIHSAPAKRCFSYRSSALRKVGHEGIQSLSSSNLAQEAPREYHVDCRPSTQHPILLSQQCQYMVWTNVPISSVQPINDHSCDGMVSREYRRMFVQ